MGKTRKQLSKERRFGRYLREYQSLMCWSEILVGLHRAAAEYCMECCDYALQLRYGLPPNADFDGAIFNGREIEAATDEDVNEYLHRQIVLWRAGLEYELKPENIKKVEEDFAKYFQVTQGFSLEDFWRYSLKGVFIKFESVYLTITNMMRETTHIMLELDGYNEWDPKALSPRELVDPLVSKNRSDINILLRGVNHRKCELERTLKNKEGRHDEFEAGRIYR